MKEDPIIQELRTVRRKIEKECGATADAYADHVRNIEKHHASRLVKLGPKTISGATEHVAEQEQIYGHSGKTNNGGVSRGKRGRCLTRRRGDAERGEAE